MAYAGDDFFKGFLDSSLRCTNMSTSTMLQLGLN